MQFNQVNLCGFTRVNSVLSGMTEVEIEEKEVLDAQIGFKCKSGQKNQFVRYAVGLFRALVANKAFSIILREMIR